ncbi:MAG: bifunctional [glutamate--ammonia ligase]-adenylyl-L-tyrosine phosphorylase/[glutamate--ammonia-ligase] adenylyltransferase [Pseudomonadales bacterium]|nr:bifunctional [glutamate--ammonia ligase]-adenylyl-L-tyrosine phosphorylase/[glutamate--ammonia-ligase] adenylyltransferase [Pseudomonadales bacterium]
MDTADNLTEELAESAERFMRTRGLALTAESRRVFALSDFARRVVERQQDWFEGACRDGYFGEFWPQERLRSRFSAELDAIVGVSGDMQVLQSALRQFRAREQLRIVWRHLMRAADVAETMASCSVMADVVIDATLKAIAPWVIARLGEPRAEGGGSTPVPPVVFALGKLGARELNLSSDIDLVMAYPVAGKTTAGRTNQQYFVALAQALIEALDPVTADGFVFRVDLRLRPYGGSGPLAMHFAAMEQYFETQGRDWERYAFIKARPCAGDIEVGERFLGVLRPFIYRRYLDYGAIDALRDMASRLTQERGNRRDVKLGAGGIRDIEFLVQLEQLIFGGREPALQHRQLLTVLATLGSSGHFPPAEVRTLEQAYLFLRDTEHSIQAEDDRQTQMLPDTEVGRERVARGLGFESLEAFSKSLEDHRRAVAAIFEDAVRPPQVSSVTKVWPDGDAAALSNAGFDDPRRAHDAMASLRTALSRPSVGKEGRTRLDALMPALLDAVLAQREGSAEVIERVVSLIKVVLRRSSYLVLLRENPAVVQRLVRLVGESRWLAEELVRQPVFLDTLLDIRERVATPERTELERELNQQIPPGSDEEAVFEGLRLFKESHVFKAAVAEVEGELPLMQVSDYLTYLAEIILEAVLEFVWRQMAEAAPEDERAFIIVGYGKLGGLELGPGSDLDLVFIHDLAGESAQFLHRLVRKLLHMLTVPTYFGPLYEVDMRLRPSGNSGTMVSSLDAFRRYQTAQAWNWEHQALVRARVVAGDAELGRRFADVRRDILCQVRDEASVRRAVVEMRERMTRHDALGQQSAAELKRGAGGIVDIEFMVQYLVLAWAHRYPALALYTDDVRILEVAGTTGVLHGEQAQALTDAYLALRVQWHRNALELGTLGGDETALEEHRLRVRDIWRELMELAGTRTEH